MRVPWLMVCKFLYFLHCGIAPYDADGRRYSMLLDARLKFRWHNAIHGALSEFQLKCHIVGGCWRKVHFHPSPLLAVGDANHVGR